MKYFDDPSGKHFSFESVAEGMDVDTFGVINFKGYEAISKSYDFEIMLVSSKKDIELEDLLQAQAVFTIHRGEDDDVLYNGILAEFDQLHEVNDVIFYRARLVPKLWWLTLTHHNQVFLEQSIPDIVEDALRDGGLETADLDVSALSGYEENAYVCQYDESHFNFFSRCLERQGIYYYFVQEDDGEVLTLTDTKFSHDALKEGSDLFYNPASGLEGKHLGEAVGSFTCRQKQLPSEIILKDYNYERPSLDITSRAEVDPVGRGVSYLYGEYFATAEDGERLADIRAEELLCKKQEFFGESTVPYIMPGFTFNMKNHYREDFNQEYLILEVTHEGNQSHLMSGGISTDSDKSHNQAIYHNSFKAIPNETQYRPDRITEKPKISGTIHAKIDSEVDSEYAQIDEQGRYRVKLPFDINDEHIDGKGSAPIRMMQSYAGKNRGMQFPLIKGTEVLLTFIEGNPDRPVIAGAVSNPETQGPVNADNLNESVIRTGGNNRIRMGDQAGQERIVLNTPKSNSWIRMGCHNDPIILNGSATVRLQQNDTVWVDPGAVTIGEYGFGDVATVTEIAVSQIFDSADNDVTSTFNKTQLGIYRFLYESGDDTAQRTVIIEDASGNDSETANIEDHDGIRIRSGASVWLEAGSRYGDFISGVPSSTVGMPSEADTDANPAQTKNMLDNFGRTPAVAPAPANTAYTPTNLLDYKTNAAVAAAGGNAAGSIKAAMIGNEVKVSSLDTFNTQEGNIYDFGGYWNYNLGNGYAENHITQDAELNIKHDAALGIDWVRFGVQCTLGVGFPIIGGVIGTIMAATTTGSKSAPVVAGFVGIGLPIAAVISTGIGLGLKALNHPATIGDVIEGPNSGAIETWARKVTMDTDTAWVDKKFGDSYNYTEGNTIDIVHGDTEEHVKGDIHEYKYGGAREQTSFSKGLLSHWEKSGGGIKQEANWDKTSGQFQSYKFAHMGWFSFSVTLPTLPKLDISVAMATLDAKLKFSAGTSFDINLAGALAMNINLVAGLFVKIERKTGGELTWNEVTGKKKFSAFGFEAAQEAAVKAAKRDLVLDKLTTQLTKKELEAVDTATSVVSNKIATKIGQHIFI